MNYDPSRAEALFLAAAEITAPLERAAFLERECAGDPVLRQRIEALLVSHDEATGFLEPGALSLEMEAEFARLKPEEAGERIGHYKLLQQIGEGGFGVVWMAEQEQPVRRRVALKIIKLGMDTKEVIARFEQERQALAMMDHPNIAKVFDAGATPFGRPYFVMELVRGIKITDYCDEASLPTAERLQLFVTVCHAVQHAHQKGIIHRDLKPSNILVTLHDGVPVPKVIDFGVAKAIQARLTERTLFTQFAQMIGTPLYMSPEQAELSGLDIDTRSDIYSLGVLLYELLTGRTPVDAETLRSAGLDEMRRIIREQEPPRPSIALQTMAAATRTTVAGHRQVEPPRLIGLLRGDLDWIVMKTLEKDRSRRYETANALALDLLRHLHDEPVLARPPSAAYRLRKMVRRNQLAFGAGAAVLVVLVAGIVVSTWEAVRATRAEGRATERAAAEAAARADADAVATFLTTVFQSPDPTRNGRTITVAETLDRAAKKLDTDLGNQPARRAKLQGVLGSTYRALGLPREAIPLLEKASDHFLKTFGPEHPDTPGAMTNLGNAYAEAGRRKEALKLYEQVIELRRNVNGPEHPDTLGAMNNLATSYFEAGHREEALKLREQILELRRKLNGPEHPDTLGTMNNLANSYYDAGRREEALKLQEEVLPLLRKVLGGEYPATLGAMTNLATSYRLAGRVPEAIELQEKSLAIKRRVLPPGHPFLAVAIGNLAVCYDAAGRGREAQALRKELEALKAKAPGPSPK